MASEHHPADFGAKLRAARERGGLSLRVIADATKISVRALEALERNDISQLPGGIFSRAFVRAYAVQVGLDPEQTIAEFITRFPHETVTQGHPRTRDRDLVDEIENGSKRRFGPALALTAAIVIVAIALLAYVVMARGRTTTAASPVTTAAEPQ